MRLQDYFALWWAQSVGGSRTRPRSAPAAPPQPHGEHRGAAGGLHGPAQRQPPATEVVGLIEWKTYYLIKSKTLLYKARLIDL